MPCRSRAGGRVLPRVGAGVVPGDGAGEAGEEVPPACSVDFLVPARKGAVHQAQAGARWDGGEGELDLG